MGDDDQGRILQQLSEEFLEETAERLGRLWAIYETARQRNSDSREKQNEFLREIHTLKGHGSAFGYPSLTVCAHHIEDRISSLIGEARWNLPEIEDLLILMEDIVDSRTDMEPSELRRRIENLASVPGEWKEPITIVWVCSARVIRHKVRRELEAFGLRVISMNDPFEAIRYISMVPPDAVVSSAVLNGLPGTDLVRALDSMRGTHEIPAVLVTSFDAEHPEIAALPRYVPIVRLGPHMSKDILRALTSLEIKTVDPSRVLRS